MLYSLDEICLTPASVSSIEHRKDVIIYNNHNKLPLFSAPMACVIDNESGPVPQAQKNQAGGRRRCGRQENNSPEPAGP